MTSHDAVSMIRRKLKESLPPGVSPKVGHSGTLDPFATGLLIILIGYATRLQEELHLMPKTYHAAIRLGQISSTDDATGEISTPIHPPHIPNKQDIANALEYVRTMTEQAPPQYAAIKIRGKKLYEYARTGESVSVPKRPITIFSIDCTRYEYPILDISVTCSTGTYIRSIARDIGKYLGTGAYCTSLVRTQIGPLELNQARTISALPGDLQSVLIPPQQLVEHLPHAILSDENVAKCKNGGEVVYKHALPAHAPIALFTKSQQLFGIGRWSPESSSIAPKKILL